MNQYLPLILVGAMLVFMIFNGRKRKAQMAEMASKIQAGAKVMLTSGIYGEIVSIDDDRVKIKSGTSTLEVAKGAVSRVIENAPEVDLEKAPARKTPAKKAAK